VRVSARTRIQPTVHKPLEDADVFRWERDFIQNVRDHPTARGAWREIEQTDSGNWARILLFHYAILHAETLPQVFQGKARMTSNLESAARASRQASARRNDPRVRLFAERRKVAAETASQTPWPFHNPNVKTIGDAAVTYTEIAVLRLEESASNVRKSLDALRRYGSKPYLVILRDYAADFGIRLGLRRLVALALCAAPNPNLDERTLGRFFALPNIEANAPLYLSSFKTFLQRLPSAIPPSHV
jgi:hypothetical protein